jgi:glycerophosphoryl diester phosphodiesterase
MSRAPDAFRRRADRPAIVGHRGVRGPAPENTLEAIAFAAREGADAVEIDVRPCKTGEIVVLHDPDLERVAGRASHAEDLALAELGRLDLGGGARVPRLEEALALARELGLGVNVEIKHDVRDRASTVRAVARVLGAWPRGHDVVVSSFDPWTLLAHHALVPRRAHGLLVHRSWYRAVALGVARMAPLAGLHLTSELVTRERIARRGRRYLAVWTVNEPGEARRVAHLGADAIITDRPGGIRAALEAD